MAQTESMNANDFPDLWGLTANEVANRKSSARLNLQEYHLDQDANVDSEVRNIESVAYFPLDLLFKNQTPFNYSVRESTEVPKSFILVFENTIKLYQLYIFFVYAINEIGSIHADRILEEQSKHFEKWMSNTQAYTLTARFDDISKAAREHAKQHLSSLEYNSLDIPIEQSIAKIFLLYNKESPFYSETNHSEDNVNFRGMDLSLSDHLGLAKDHALKAYANFFNTVIVEV